MKRINTEYLLTLGMALTSDKRSMERRVRGVFARKKSAKGVLALSLVLALTLGFAAFTTACQPGQPTSSGGNAITSGGNAIASGGNAITSGGNALASGGNALASGGNALASSGNATATSGELTKEKAMKMLSNTLRSARRLVIPHVEQIVFTERGEWERQKELNDANRTQAAEAFLKITNAIFSTNFTPNDLDAMYYIDKSGNRPSIWRFDSKDGKIAGAVNAENLAFLSADCINMPTDALHDSLTSGGKIDPDKLDLSSLTGRIAKLFGGTVTGLDQRGDYSVENATAGWMIKRSVVFSLGDGRYCAINAYADQNLTPTTICIYPDEDCANENVFWRADLEQTGNASKLLSPQDFREGEPGKDDLAKKDALSFFNKLFETAGYTNSAANGKPAEPNATFYVDHSGTRENYWHLEGSDVSFDLTSKTKRMLNLKANGLLGSKLGLTQIPYAQMGGEEYAQATRKLIAALFDNVAITSVGVNAVYDEHYCTMDAELADGTIYEIMYQDGLIVDATRFVYADPGYWTEIPGWLAKWTEINPETGRATLKGYLSGVTRVSHNWLADCVYVNSETGELFLKVL